MKENMKEKKEKIEVKIEAKIKAKIKELKIKLQKTVYIIKKKIYDLKYRRSTYISEKGMWVSTVVFPGKMTEDGICGITDVFAGNEKQVDFESLHSVYIKDVSDSGNIHRDVVKCVKNGYVMKNFELKSGVNV